MQKRTRTVKWHDSVRCSTSSWWAQTNHPHVILPLMPFLTKRYLVFVWHYLLTFHTEFGKQLRRVFSQNTLNLPIKTKSCYNRSLTVKCPADRLCASDSRQIIVVVGKSPMQVTSIPESYSGIIFTLVPIPIVTSLQLRRAWVKIWHL